MPGAFTKGTNHFAHAGTPDDNARLAEYEAGPYKGYGKRIQEAFAAIVPDDADIGAVAEAIVKVVDAPFGKRPFRVHIDPTEDGAEVAFGVIDRVRAEMLNRVHLDTIVRTGPDTGRLCLGSGSFKKRDLVSAGAPTPLIRMFPSPGDVLAIPQ